MARNRNADLRKRLWRFRYIYLLGFCGMATIFIFNYLPMYAIITAFQDYNPFRGVLGSRWVGFEHFSTLFRDPDFYKMFGNTITISLLSLATFPLPIILALLLNEVRSPLYKKFVQTTIYMPHFLSWTIVASLTYMLLSTQSGLINKIAVSIGIKPYAYLFDQGLFYPLLILQQVWKNIGWNSIVYLAAISGVDPTLYEAARIDGANRLQQIWHVTVMTIMPTVIVMLILAMGSIMSVNFEQIFIMQNAMVKDQARVFETYIYEVGIMGTQYSYTTAIGLFKSVISSALVLFTNWIVERMGFDGIV
jgi:putative aldouronate transport system permease protein